MTSKMSLVLVAGVLAAGLGEAPEARAQSGESLFGVESLGLTYGPYIRAELGYDLSLVGNGFWDPPGADDPRVFFGLDGSNAGYGSVAAGFDWMNGTRADVSLSYFTANEIAGDWSRTEPPTLGPHASMSAQVSTIALMGNVFYSPFESSGRQSAFNPYLTAGLGIAINDMADWTRINEDNLARPTRQFEGATKADIAWSVGIGTSWRTEALGSREVLIDAGVRYFDLGQAVGGATPLPGEGERGPRTPLTIDMESVVFSVGVRVPLSRN